MEERLSLLKTNFNNLIDIKQNNIATLQFLDARIKKIKEIYAEFISVNREQLFIFTLDSFHFQSKLIDIEYEDVLRIFHAITNRMYCDYYKLFKILIEYIHENVPDKKLIELIKVNNNYPVYKDLEPFKQYDFQYIQNLHEIILVLMVHLNGYIANKEHDLRIYQTKNKIGFNIDNFVNTFNFNTIIMKEKFNLFLSYMEFFHILHTKYFKRFTMKVQLMLNQINNDIKLENPNDHWQTKKDIVNEYKYMDADILRDLKDSMNIDIESSAAFTSLKHTVSSVNESSDKRTIYSNQNIQFITDIMNEYVSDLTDDNVRTSPISEIDSTSMELSTNLVLSDSMPNSKLIQTEITAILYEVVERVIQNQ